MPRLITIIIAFAATLTLAAGCDPVVQRKFDVLLTDRTKGSKVEVVDGQLAAVMAIVEEVVNRWDFESQPLDPKSRRIGYLGGWTRGDVGGVINFNVQVQRGHADHALVYLNFAFGTKETPAMRDIRHDLMQRLVDRFGADHVKLTGVWDKKSLRS